LSEYEKKSLLKFLSLYLGSALVFITVIATIIYYAKVENISELQKQKLKNFCSFVSAEIIDSHMRGDEFILSKNSDFSMALIDKEGKIIYGDIKRVPKLEQGFYEADGRLGIVDGGPRLHHGIKYVVAEEHGLEKQKQEALITSLLIWAVSIVLVGILGFSLSKQFLAPVRQEIQKLDDFVKASAHELNTPITSLILSLDSIKAEIGDVSKIEQLKASAKAISKIYDDLTYYVQKETIKKEDNWIDIAELASERVLFYSKIAKAKNVVVDIKTEPFIFNIDKTAATRLIDNLLSNAIKYSKPGGVVLISVSDKLIEVLDDGIGIDEPLQKTIFDKFERATKSGGGFGLGLYIVKTICDEYGIKIELESKKEKGSKFRLVFS
jgi:two-component system OmpR family sensor kinase